MNVCKMLQAAKRDEAGGILSYNKLKNDMPSEHTEHIETIERIIGDEYDHLQDVEEIIRDMGCPELTKEEDIHMIAHEIYEKVNEIEKKAREIGGKEGEKLHKMAEELERVTREIKAIVTEEDIGN